jgi:glycosyltransferase involved in cell wall biosynthesis
MYSAFALDSSGFSFDVLVVDDGSTDDGTSEALLEFASNDLPNFCSTVDIILLWSWKSSEYGNSSGGKAICSLCG